MGEVKKDHTRPYEDARKGGGKVGKWGKDVESHPEAFDKEYADVKHGAMVGATGCERPSTTRKIHVKGHGPE